MGAGASASGGDPTEEDLLAKIHNGGMDQAIALEFVVKKTIENQNLKLTESNAPLFKAVVDIAAKSEGHVRVDACCVIRNMSVDKGNKQPLCEKSLGLLRALELVLFEDSGNARVHATCVLQNLATVDANRPLMLDPDLKLIEALVYTIEIDDAGAREHACATMWNIVCNKDCRDAVAAPRVFAVLSSALNSEHAASRMNAAGALWNFSTVSRSRDQMRRVNDDGHKLFEGLVSMLHADHGIGAAKACGTVWNLTLDDRCAQFFCAKDLGLLPLLKRIIKREPAGKLRYYACGALRSLSRLQSSKDQLFTADNADLFSAFGAVLKESLTEMCYQHANINHRPDQVGLGQASDATDAKREKRATHRESRGHGHGHHRHHHGDGHGHKHRHSHYGHDGSGGNSSAEVSPRREKGREREHEDSDSRAHHHALPHISETMDTLEQVCNAIVNLSMIPTARSEHHHHHHHNNEGSGHSSAREAAPTSSYNMSSHEHLGPSAHADMTSRARMIISDPAHGILAVLSELLHYACSFSVGQDIPTEYIVLYQMISVTIVGISSTSNSVVIQRLLDSQIHVACIDILKHMFTESRAMVLKSMERTGDIVPLLWKKSDGEVEEDDRHYYFAKIGNYLLNYLLNLAKHYYITATTMKHSHAIFPVLMECTWTEDELIMREELRRKKASRDEHKDFTVKGMLTFQQREAQKHAEDAENRDAEKQIAGKVTNYNYAEGIKVSLLIALLYGRDNENHKVVISKNESIIGSVSTASVVPDESLDIHLTGFEFCHGRLMNVMTNILSAARHILRHRHSDDHEAAQDHAAAPAAAVKALHRPAVVKIEVNPNVIVDHAETDREHIVFRFGSPAFSIFMSGICSLCCSDFSKDELRANDALFKMEDLPAEEGSEVRRRAHREAPAPAGASLDAFKESDYARMSMLAQIYQLVEKVLYIYVHHHHIGNSSDEFAIMRTAVDVLLQLAAVHGKHGSLDPCGAVLHYYRRLKHNYRIDIPLLLEELLVLLSNDCECIHSVPTDQTRRNLDCIIQVQILLTKIHYKEPPPGDADTETKKIGAGSTSPKPRPKAALEEPKEPTHIMACYYARAHDPSEQVSVHQQQAELFVTQLRALGFSVWSMLEGSDVCPALPTSLLSDIMATRSSPRLSPLMLPPVDVPPAPVTFDGVDKHLRAVVKATTLFIVFVSSECHDSVYCQIECALVREHLLGAGRAEEGTTIRNKPAVLFVSLQPNYLRAAPSRPTFDYDWLNTFAAEMNEQEMNLLQIALEPKFAQRSKSALDGKDSAMDRVPAAEGSSDGRAMPLLCYYELDHMSDVVTELSYVLQQHFHTVASNKPKVAAEFCDDPSADDAGGSSAGSARPKGDYEGAWEYINDVQHVLNIDDTMADLSDLGIDHFEDFEPLITRHGAEQISRGLKTMFRKDFMGLLGYTSPRA